jgi:ABC-type lipoprotein export system ATPase subunit
LSDFKSSLLIRIGSQTRKLSDEALVSLAKTFDESKAKAHGYIDHHKDNDKCLELGRKTAEITRDCLQDAQKSIPEGKCLIILPYDTSDGLSKLDWKSHPQSDNYFMQSAHAFETRDFENIELFLGIKTDKNQEYIENFIKTMGGKPKPVVSGSDAHKVLDYGNYPSNRVTWIKADPTFEGLKYTIYDPSERVCIQLDNPCFEFPKPYFSKIEIQEGKIFPQSPEKKIQFSSTNLELNSGLVAIIGGRGSGKSILLDAIAKTFQRRNEYRYESEDKEISMQEGFTVGYTKNDGDVQEFKIGDKSELIYLHVHQREVQDKVKNPERLSEAILDMLGISLSFDKFIHDGESIDNILLQIRETKDWLTKHDKNHSQSNIDRLNQIIGTITTESNKQKLETYANNISSIKSNEKHLTTLNNLKSKLNKFVVELNNEINSVSHETSFSVPSINFEPQIESIETALSALNLRMETLKSSNARIQKDLEEEEIEGDPTTLLQKVKEFRSKIELDQETIRQINKQQNTLESLIARRDLFANHLDTEMKKLINHINDRWNEKRECSNDLDEQKKDLINNLLTSIDIYGEIYFNKDELYKKIRSSLNGNKFRSNNQLTSLDKIKQMIPIDSYDSYKSLIENKPIIKCNGEEPLTLEQFIEQEDYFNTVDGFLEVLFSDSKREDYLKVIARIKYDGKSPEELSIGQRGTLYLCLKLATESFFDPIIIDQPEDDLDNEFIMNKLVPIFTTIKKYRQVIIATHNANLVVNADAEQVIVAKNDSEKLSYVSGSLENHEIRSKICDVLEGGKEAFRKREQKYGFR